MSSKSQTSQRISSRVLLGLLAPDIVEAILDGRQPAELQLDDLLAGFPLEWQGQLIHFAPHYLHLTNGSEEAGTSGGRRKLHSTPAKSM